MRRVDGVGGGGAGQRVVQLGRVPALVDHCDELLRVGPASSYVIIKDRAVLNKEKLEKKCIRKVDRNCSSRVHSG